MHHRLASPFVPTKKMTSLKIAALCVLLGVIGTDGKPPSKIVGGPSASDNEFPYQVSLRMYGQHTCGGSILDARHVLTAAHCVEEGNQLINRMTVVTSSNSLSSGGKSHAIQSITCHPGYISSADMAWKNDLAIITLRTPIELNSRTRAVRLPTRNASAGSTAIASGWGNHLYPGGPIPDDLRKLEMRLLAPGQCRIPGTGAISETHLCAYSKMGSGVCSGDSGGPLVCNGELVGVTSFVIPCGKGYPDVFTRVYSYVDWIKQTCRRS